ncbi:alginate O-acetyltransferase AlgF [Alcaligenaceae bacterium B3P038]|nr:alginate O-acetyltransferase AlgF [Alcaligenaceae bacterium B3P038]
MKPSVFMRMALSQAGVALVLVGAAAHAAETQLYDTGPSEDASFVRFVNGTTQPVALAANGKQATVTLDAVKPATDYIPVKANSAISGTLTQSSSPAANVSLKVAPGAFSTVIALNQAGALSTLIVSETPDDFNSMKASLAFYAADSTCTNAGLNAAGRDVAIFSQVEQGSLKRRSINPVKLAVQLICGGQPRGLALDLGELEAGQRYSVFAVPAAEGSRLLLAPDTLAR